MSTALEHIKDENSFRELLRNFNALDWYDGVVIGLGPLPGTTQWVIGCLCYFNPSNGERVMLIIDVFPGRGHKLTKGGYVGHQAYVDAVGRYVRKFKGSAVYVHYHGYRSDIFDVNQTTVDCPMFCKDTEQAIEKGERFKSELLKMFPDLQ